MWLDAVGVGPVAWTQLLFTSLAAYFDFSAQPRLLGRGLMLDGSSRHSPGIGYCEL